MAEIDATFSPGHHALLFAWLAREAVKEAGEREGEAAIRQGVRRYGRERGQRMSARCRANGHPLTMLNFFAYSEWQAQTGQRVSTMVRDGMDARGVTEQCPWHGAWRAAGLLPYGRLYCLDIDEAVLSGFSPQLSMEVISTLSNGGPHCEFVFHGAKLTLWNQALLLYRRSIHPGKTAVMPWSYHLGHLYSAMTAVLSHVLGSAGRRATSSAMGEFAGCYGEPAAGTILAYEGTDFTVVPGATEA